MKWIGFFLYTGTSIIVIAWIAQSYQTLIKKDKSLSSLFLLIYALGCAMLAIGNLYQGTEFGSRAITLIGFLNAVLVIVAAVLASTLVVRPAKTNKTKKK